MNATERSRLRTLIADYMASEGCSCCQDDEAHERAETAIAQFLSVPHYADKPGWDFNKFRTERRKK